MLKKYKNGFLEIIQKCGFDPHHFRPTEEIDRGDEVFTLQLLNTPLRFKVRNVSGVRHLFQFRYVRYLPEFPSTDYEPYSPRYSIESIYVRFEKWLQQEVKDYFDDLLVPDLWEQINLQKPLVTTTVFEEQDVLNFSEEEKAQLRLSLAEFRLLIAENFNPTEEQMQVIDNRLDYVSAALDRLNRFDWKSVLLSTTVSISVALSLDTARGKLLFDLLKRVLSNVLYLLSGGEA